jgi:hypothetical protein
MSVPGQRVSNIAQCYLFEVLGGYASGTPGHRAKLADTNQLIDRHTGLEHLVSEYVVDPHQQQATNLLNAQREAISSNARGIGSVTGIMDIVMECLDDRGHCIKILFKKCERSGGSLTHTSSFPLGKILTQAISAYHRLGDIVVSLNSKQRKARTAGSKKLKIRSHPD